MINNSTLMLCLAEIETDLMVDVQLSKINPSHPIDPFGIEESIENIGSLSVNHNVQVSESLIVYLNDLEKTIPGALNCFIKGRQIALYS